MTFLSTIRTKVRKILKEPAYPTAPDCPYCSFPNVGYKYAKSGLQHHIRKAHPDKVNNLEARFTKLFQQAYDKGYKQGSKEVAKMCAYLHGGKQ